MKKERGTRMKRFRKRERLVGTRRVCERETEREREKAIGKKRVCECVRETERKRARIR